MDMLRLSEDEQKIINKVLVKWGSLDWFWINDGGDVVDRRNRIEATDTAEAMQDFDDTIMVQKFLNEDDMKIYDALISRCKSVRDARRTMNWIWTQGKEAFDKFVADVGVKPTDYGKYEEYDVDSLTQKDIELWIEDNGMGSRYSSRKTNIEGRIKKYKTELKQKGE